MNAPGPLPGTGLKWEIRDHREIWTLIYKTGEEKEVSEEYARQWLKLYYIEFES